jgi:hypothetical protein
MDTYSKGGAGHGSSMDQSSSNVPSGVTSSKARQDSDSNPGNLTQQQQQQQQAPQALQSTVPRTSSPEDVGNDQTTLPNKSQ